MSSNTCPVCDEGFSSAGRLRAHAREAHGACHYCGDELGEAVPDETLYTHWLAAHPDALSAADRSRAEEAVDGITIGDRFRHGGVGAAVSGLPRRAFLVGGGVAAIGGIAGLGIAATELAGGPTIDVTTNEPGPTAGAPLPASPDEYRYATMGTADAAASVTYFGSWKCPVCKQFEAAGMPDLVTDYVVPGDVRLTFRNLSYAGGEPFLGPDAPAAGHAGLAVWNDDPDSYWRFHEVVFRNQPPEGRQWATAANLERLAEAAGVDDPGVVRSAVEEERYTEALDATDEAAVTAGVTGTPKLVVDGRVLNPLQTESTRAALDEAIANG